jgi:hypothetical protein
MKSMAVAVYCVLYPRVKCLGHRLLHFVKLWLKDACVCCLAYTDVCIATWQCLLFKFSHWNIKGSNGSDTLLLRFEIESRDLAVSTHSAYTEVPLSDRGTQASYPELFLWYCSVLPCIFRYCRQLSIGPESFHSFYRSLLVGHPVIQCLWVLNHSLLLTISRNKMPRSSQKQEWKVVV